MSLPAAPVAMPASCFRHRSSSHHRHFGHLSKDQWLGCLLSLCRTVNACKSSFLSAILPPLSLSLSFLSFSSSLSFYLWSKMKIAILHNSKISKVDQFEMILWKCWLILLADWSTKGEARSSGPWGNLSLDGHIPLLLPGDESRKHQAFFFLCVIH